MKITVARLLLLLVLIPSLLLLSACALEHEDEASLQYSAVLVGPPIMQGAFHYGENDLIEGVGYRTATLTGKTGYQGVFSYYDGEEVEFFIGDISLGRTPGAARVYLWDLDPNGLPAANDLTVSNRITNVARFLQSIDMDRQLSQGTIYTRNNLDNGIFISDAMNDAAIGMQINFDQTPLQFEQDMDVISAITTLTPLTNAMGPYPQPLVSANYARWHVARALLKIKGTAITWTDYLNFQDGRRWSYRYNYFDGTNTIPGTAVRYSRQIKFRHDPIWLAATSTNGGANDFRYYSIDTTKSEHQLAHQTATESSDTIYQHEVDLKHRAYISGIKAPAIAFLDGMIVHGKEIIETGLSMTVEGVTYNNVLHYSFTANDGFRKLESWYDTTAGLIQQVETMLTGETHSISLQTVDVITTFPDDPLWLKNLSNALIERYLDVKSPILRDNLIAGVLVLGTYQDFITEEDVRTAYDAIYYTLVPPYVAGVTSEITRVSALYPLDDEWIVTMLLADYITNVFQFGVVSWAYIKIYDDPMFSKMTQTIGDMYLAGLAYLVTTGVLDPAEVAKFIY